MDAMEKLLPMRTNTLRQMEWSLNLVSHSQHPSGLLVEPADVPAPEMELQHVTVTTRALVPTLTPQLCSQSIQLSLHVKTIS